MKNDEKVTARLPSEERLRIQELISEGKFKNLSQVIRTALTEFLEKE